MTWQAQAPYPYPSKIDSIEDVRDYLSKLYRALVGGEAGVAEKLEYAFQDLWAFKTITGITNDVVADQKGDTLTLAAVGPLTIVGTAATDTITWTWAHLGFESLSDPGADRIAFWDDGETAFKWLAPDGTTIEISGTTLQVLAGGLDHGGLSGLGDDDHTQYLLADGSRNLAGTITLDDGVSINLQETLNFTGATTENLIKMPDNLLDALSIQEGSNKYITFDTVNDEEDIFLYKSVDILHTATHADDHALEIDTDAAAYGDVKAIDLDYITGNIVKGKDEGIILINIDETAAGDGEVFGLEVLSTDGGANIHGMKVGPVVHPIHQDAGTFIDATFASNNTPTDDVEVMRDGLITPVEKTTAIFESDTDYIIIGADAAFQDLELIFTTVSSKDIKPTFWYSVDGGSDNFTQFTPVDGTDGCRHTGVISWDASDLTGHVADDTTGKFDIKIIRTKGGSFTTPVLGYAKTASTTEYVWDQDGDVSIRNLTATGTLSCGDVTGGTYNALTLVAQATSFTIAGGASVSKLLTVDDNFVVSTQLTAIGNNTTHRGSVGTDHGYIDQDLQVSASPTFVSAILAQGALDTAIFELRSTDVTHGMTTFADTNAYATFQKASATGGGISIYGFSELDYAMANIAFTTTCNTTKDVTGLASCLFYGAKRSGTTITDVDADTNILGVRARRTGAWKTVFLVDEDGDVYYEGALVPYDRYDDCTLVEDTQNILAGKLGEFINYNEADLVRIGILGAPLKDGGLVSHKNMTALLLGAISQLNKKVGLLESKVKKLK